MNRWIPFAALGVLILAAASPLWPPAPFYFLDDGFLHLFRVAELDRVLRQGVLYPRWAPDFAYGYGYPVFNFYAPLAYYLTEALHILGLGLPTAIMAAFVVILAIAATGAYALGADLFAGPGSRRSGLLAAAAYVFFPYFLLDIYVRGAIAEALAAAWLPWLLWSLRRAMTRQTIGSAALFSIFSTALILSHNLIAFLAAPVVALFALWQLFRLPRAERRPSLLRACGGVLLGVGLAGICWIPAFAELHLVALSRESKALSALMQSSFLSLGGAVQYSLTYVYRDQPYALALVPMLLAAIGLAAALRDRVAARGAAVLFGATALIGTVLLLDGTRPLWLGMPLLSTVQFPWRLEALIGLGVAVLISGLPAASTASFVPARWSLASAIPAKYRALIGYWLAAAIAVVLIWVGLAGLTARRLENPRGDLQLGQMARFELNTRGLGFGSLGEYLPLTVKLVTSRLDAPRTEGNPPTISVERYDAVRRVLTVTTPSPSSVLFRTFYFPGWQASIDGKAVDAFPTTALGLLTVSVPAGTHRVEVSWGDTLPRQTGTMVSLVALVVLASLIFIGVRRREKEAIGVLGLVVAAASIVLPPLSVALSAAPAATQSLHADVSPQLRLIGLGVDDATLDSSAWHVPGTSAQLRLTVLWQVKQQPQDAPLVWRLIDSTGKAWANLEQLSRYGTGFPTAWVPNEIVEDHYDLPLAGVPAGTYTLQVAPADSSRFATISVLKLEQGSEPSAAPRIAHPIQAQVGDSIQFLGYDAPAVGYPGQALPLTLYWTTEKDLNEDWTVFVHLTDSSGKLVAQRDGLTQDGFYPTMLWRPGETVVDSRQVLLPEDLRPGLYHWSAGMYRFEDLERLPVTTSAGRSENDEVELGDLKVPMNAQGARPGQTVEVSLGPIQLVGFDLAAQDANGNLVARGEAGLPSRLSARSGQSLLLRLYWQTTARLDANYKVFIHIVDQRGNLAAQQDMLPGSGEYPTGIWDPGERVLDSHLVPITLSPASYSVLVGMYDAATGERLPAVGADGQLLKDRQVEVGRLDVAGK